MAYIGLLNMIRNRIHLKKKKSNKVVTGDKIGVYIVALVTRWRYKSNRYEIDFTSNRIPPAS